MEGNELTYEDFKIIPEIENHDQFESYDIHNECFLRIYENKGLVSSDKARDYFVSISKKVFWSDTSRGKYFCSTIYRLNDEQTCGRIIDCLINALNGEMSLSEVTALANFIKSDEESYYLAGFEIFWRVKVVRDSSFKDFIEQCGSI